MKKYTVEEWFSILPPDIRRKAIANAKAYLSYPKIRFAQTESDFKAAISGCFIYKNTKEGHKYWEEISDKDWGKPQESKPKQ